MALPAPSQISLPKSSLTKLKCKLCQGYLSVPPICFDKDGYTCGRCRSSGNRVVIYEELAKYMIYPCINEKCKVELLWGQVKNHEINCPHKVIQCPHGSCKTSFEIRSVREHFADCHKVDVHENNFTILRRLRDIPFKNFNADRKVFLVNDNNVPYIVMVYIDCVLNTNKTIRGYQLGFGVYSIRGNQGPAKDTTYQVDLVIKNNTRKIDYSWKYQEIKLFDGRAYCFDCFAGNCTISNHSNNKKNFLTSRLDNVDKMPEMQVTYTIKIVSQKQPQQNISSHLGGLMELSKLMCFLCRDFMCAPIFTCRCGRTLCCFSCRRKLSQCPHCKETFGQLRNSAAEETAESLVIPCQNVGSGCTYTGLIKRVKQHNLDCKYNFM